MSAKHLPPASSPGDGRCSARLGAQGNMQEGFLSSMLTEETGLGVRVPGTLALLQPHPLGKGHFQPRPRAAPRWCRLVSPRPHPGTSGVWPLPRGHLEGGEGELREQLDEAQHSPGMLVHHEGEDDLMRPQQGDECQCGLGEPGGVGQGHHSGPLSWPLLPILCSRRPPRPATWVTEPSPTKYPGTGCLEGRK